MDKQLSEISNTSFTKREIDVLSCLLHNRGEKKIAEILSISHRTVETHISNIKMKLSGRSRDQIIDFLESSGKINELRKWYGELLIYNSYIHTLKKINDSSDIKKTCHFTVKVKNSEYLKLFDKIKADLTSAGIEIVKKPQNGTVNIYIQDDYSHAEKDPSAKALYIYLVKKKNDENKEYIDFTDSSEYIPNTLLLLRKILPQKEVVQIIDEFDKNSLNIRESFCNDKPSVQTINTTGKDTKKFYVLGIIVLVFIALFFTFIFRSEKIVSKSITQPIVNGTLPISSEHYYLERPEIIQKMDKLLSKPNNLNIIALVGIGGSGKSTLARQYAYNQNASIVWEVNAETTETISSSLECLTYATCSSEQEKAEFYKLQNIPDRTKREEMLAIFLSKKLKQHLNWIIIYDNAQCDCGQVLQKYLPNDPTIWGNGKIIITTTNSNIINSSYIKPDNVIYVPKLTEEESFKLFTQITSSDIKYSQNIKDFLKELPPFPLDVTQAAHYIKNTGMYNSQYLKYLHLNDKTFDDSQESLLQNISGYTKTRSKIVRLSVKHIIESNKEFHDLLLLVSLLDSEDIPKKLLITYKGEVLTNQFLQEMSKFSLITTKDGSLYRKTSPNTFSIPQTIQNISLKYLTQTPQKIPYKQFAPVVENFMENQLYKGDYEKLKATTIHIEKLLTNQHLFTKELVFALNTVLSIYYDVVYDNVIKAKDLLKHSRSLNHPASGIGRKILAKNSVALGIVYRNLGKYQKSEKFLQQALELIDKNFDHISKYKSSALTSLAITYNFTGKYALAENLFIEATKINPQLFGPGSRKNAWSLSHLAYNYISQGKYEEAETILSNLSTKFSGKRQSRFLRAAWIEVFIGKLELHRGNYTVAEEHLKKSLKLFQKFYGTNSTGITTALVYLGELNTDLKNYEEAKNYLQHAKSILEALYGEPNLNLYTAQIYRSLCKISADLQHYEQAKEFLNLSYNFFQNQHPTSSYHRALTKLYIEEVKKSEGKENNMQEVLPLLRDLYGKDHIKLKKFIDL